LTTAVVSNMTTVVVIHRWQMTQISASELEVMDVLWARPGLAASDVHDALGDGRDWNVRTVKTFLARLVEKGALTTVEDGRRYLYFPAIKEDEYKAEAATQFIDRVFSGRAAPLVAHLADARGLTREDIAELEKLLGELKK
jgi:BlaI family penicillinase repressor